MSNGPRTTLRKPKHPAPARHQEAVAPTAQPEFPSTSLLLAYGATGFLMYKSFQHGGLENYAAKLTNVLKPTFQKAVMGACAIGAASTIYDASRQTDGTEQTRGNLDNRTRNTSTRRI